MSDGSLINLIDALTSNKVITSAATTNSYVTSLPEPFYYTESDLKTYNNYVIDLPRVQNVNPYEGVSYIEIITIPTYDQATNKKIGTATLHNSVIKLNPDEPAIVNEKVLFIFDKDKSSITTDHIFFSDTARFTHPGTYNQRIISGNGQYLNLFGYHVVVEKREDKNRYVSLVHN